MRATLKQKKLIKYINRKLNLSEEESREILSTIKTFDEADRYIKKFLPIVKFKDLRPEEIKKVILYLIEQVELLSEEMNDQKTQKEVV